ncbi:MAG: hypothetical protein AB1656_05105 [Candidatus Omnitrophota bacterium]
MTARIESDVADYIAAHVFGLSRWNETEQTGNVRAGARNAHCTGLQVAVRRTGGAGKSPITGMRKANVEIAVYGDGEAALDMAEEIFALFERPIGFVGATTRIANVMTTEDQPRDMSLIEGDVSRYDIPLRAQYSVIPETEEDEPSETRATDRGIPHDLRPSPSEDIKTGIRKRTQRTTRGTRM